MKEQEAMRERNVRSSNLLFDTCKFIRKIRDDNNWCVSGSVIGGFVYDALGNWRWETDTSNTDANSHRKFGRQLLSKARDLRRSIQMPGSGDSIAIEQNEVRNLEKILECMLCAKI
ncbi:hypothetical protein [Helicobacter labacensis]|uniref:hypothetical protein n=1 Tax=Helicobacter labacensis TaxID=2316079 RepID=UPI000EAC5863|nr:hypothetical protein [Helicobacter labacensis]